jgi:transcriptional regulator with XRE-family HTH domain
MITAVQCRMARAALDWGVRELAAAARISFTTVNRFERGVVEPHPFTLEAMRRAFEAAGILFPDARCVCAPGEPEQRAA